VQLARSLSRRPKLESRSDNVGPHFPSHDLADPNGKHRRQNFILTDSSRPSQLHPRIFSPRVRRRACAGLALPTLGRGLHLGERVRAALRAAARRGWPVAATAKVAVSPILLGNRVFRSRGSPCVCPVGSFRRRALPYTPRSVRGPRGVARRGAGGRSKLSPKHGFCPPRTEQWGSMAGPDITKNGR
jgi:hypothetical protein